MDYEKKYKEALERMKSWARGEHHECFTEAQAAAEFIFPELKESEGERIRKALIKYFTLSDDNADYQCCGVHCKDILAWLEKQGGPIKEHNKQASCANPCPMKLVEEQKPEDKVEPKFKVGDSIKTANEAPLTITKITDSGYWSEDLFICSFGNADKWELVEQKPSNKVEPKFHEGDWITIKE